MTYKLLVAATLSLGLGTAVAMAQTDATQPGAATAPGATDAQLPMGWEGPIGDAFFADPELGTLHTDEEIRANWDALSDEQQAQVRAHCDTVDTAAAPAGDMGAGADTDDDVTTGSTTPDADMHTASIGQVCGLIDTM